MQGSLKQLIETPDDFLKLEPAQLAAYFLMDVLKHQRDQHFLPSMLADYVANLYGDQPEIKEHTMQALSWLMTEGLVIPDFNRSPAGFSLRVSPAARNLSTQDEVNELVFLRKNLPKSFLHPLVLQHAAPIFYTGSYDTAVFEAFKQVEIVIRQATGLQETGVKLAGEAFKVNAGPLADQGASVAEQEGVRNLFSGAFGCIRNPPGHQNLAFYPKEAAELMVFAGHLIWMVEQRVKAKSVQKNSAGP